MYDYDEEYYFEKSYSGWCVVFILVTCFVIGLFAVDVIKNVNNLRSEVEYLTESCTLLHNELHSVKDINIDLQGTINLQFDEINELEQRLENLKLDVENFKDIYNRHTHPCKARFHCWKFWC